MKLIEKVIYSGILFLVLYVVISVGLRVFEVTSVYQSHLIGGVIATLASMGLFGYLIVKK
jgi:hypothetical protein